MDRSHSNIVVNLYSETSPDPTSTTRQMNQPSKLLQLPSELRNKIYELVLIQPHAIRIPLGQSESSKRALLRANHQIHDEAVGIYYGNNAFLADCGVWFLNADLICWLRSLGWKKRLLLKDIRLSLRQQRVFALPGSVADPHFFLTALIKRLDGMGLLLPLDAVRVEVGEEYLPYSELDARVRASREKKEEHY